MSDSSKTHGTGNRRSSKLSFQPSGPFASMHSAFQSRQNQLPDWNESVAESDSKVKHPCQLCDLDGRCAQLLGVGVRSKRKFGVPFKVYSVGMYADVDALQTRLDKHVGTSAKQVANHSSVLQAMKMSDVEKEIRMVITMGSVPEDTFWQAMHERLAPILQQGKAADILPDFKEHFKGTALKKGTEIRLAMTNNDKVTTIIDSEHKGTLESKPLANALMDIYLGKEAVSPSMSEDFLSTVTGVLEHRKPPKPANGDADE